MKEKIIFIFSICIALNHPIQGQTIEELEYDISWSYSGENYSTKISKARFLLRLDPFNERAVRYICDYYQENKIDSISLLFDKIIEENPNRVEPFLLRVKLLFLEYNWRERDRYNKIKISFLNKALEINNADPSILYYTAETYYKDFIYPYEEEKIWFVLDTTVFKSEPRQVQKTSTFIDSGRQALDYFYQLWEVDEEIRDVIYFPIKQLECELEKVIGSSSLISQIDDNNYCYFPSWYFANLSDGWECNKAINYLFEVEMSKRVIGRLTDQLVDLAEPCIYNQGTNNESIVYRFTWLRSFDNPIVVRVEKNINGIFLFAKIGNGAGGYEPKGIKKSINRRMSVRKWDEFISKLEKIDFKNLPNEHYIPMTDGATWTLEQKEGNIFKAHRTNNPDDDLMSVCLYLVKLAKIRVKEKDVY